MPTLRRHRWAFIAAALTVGVCILLAALTSYGHLEGLYLPPVFLNALLVLLVTAHRRISDQLPAYIREPFASDLAFRGPPTF